MLDEQGFEEGFGMIESLKCAFVAPEGLGQCVLLIILHFLLYTNNIIIHMNIHHIWKLTLFMYLSKST
jgi:hypothetical protein